MIEAARREDVLKHFQLPEDDFKWAVEVIESPQANAFCLPGGKMVVYTGHHPIAETDAALAAVIGHESRTRLRITGRNGWPWSRSNKWALAALAWGLAIWTLASGRWFLRPSAWRPTMRHAPL